MDEQVTEEKWRIFSTAIKNILYFGDY